MPEGLQDDRARGIVPFDQFPGPVAIPTTDIQDDPGLCLRVNATWAALLSSLLDRLDQPDVWIGTESQVLAARQKVIALQVLLDGINDCMCIDDFTASAESGTPVSVTYDPLTNNFHFVIPPGETGPAGATGPAGPAGATGPAGPAGGDGAAVTAPGLPDLSGSNDPRCTLTTFIRNELEEITDNVLSLIESASDLPSALVAVVGSFVEMGANAGPIVDGISVAGDVGISLIRAAMTTEFWDNVQCDLHCNLDDTTPVLTQTVRDLWIIDLQARQGLLSAYGFVSLVIQMGSQSGWDYLAWRAQFADPTENCGFCGCLPYDWEHVFDFTVSNGGFVVRPSMGVGAYSAGVGWVSSYNPNAGGNSLTGLAIEKTGFTASEVVYVGAEITAVPGTYEGAGNGAGGFGANNANSQALSWLYSPPIPEVVSDAEEGSLANAIRLSAGLYSGILLGTGRGASGSVTLTRMMVRGNGPNPFV